MAGQDIEKAMKEAHSDIQWEKQNGKLKKRIMSSTLPQVHESDITVTKSNLDEMPVTTLNVHEGVPLQIEEKNSWFKVRKTNFCLVLKAQLSLHNDFKINQYQLFP